MKKLIWFLILACLLIVVLVTAATWTEVDSINVGNAGFRVIAGDGCRGSNFTVSEAGTVTNLSIEFQYHAGDNTYTLDIFDVDVDGSPGDLLVDDFDVVTVTGNGFWNFYNADGFSASTDTTYWWCVLGSGAGVNKLHLNSATAGRAVTRDGATIYDSSASCDAIVYIIDAEVTDACSCPETPANWRINLADHCNLTANCNIFGFNVSFENGTAGDYFNCTANYNLTAKNFNFSAAGAGTLINMEAGCYFNTTQPP